MGRPKNLLFLFGTRPEVIKLAPVIRLARQDDAFQVTLLHTGQHKELAQEMLNVFGLEADILLDVMHPNQNFFSLGSLLLERLGKIFQNQKYDLIFVQGDTTSVFLGALAGYYTKTSVAHVEAGLRTHDKFSPYPEEMNRRLTASLADLHFPPTPSARTNLLNEGISEDRIHVTGNTVIDSLLFALTLPYSPPTGLREFYQGTGKPILVTTHRRENFGEPHRNVFRAILRIARENDDVTILFPVHPNPNVRKEVGEFLENHPRILLSAPLGYLDFIHAMKNSYLILSDSGGVQEEAPTLKKPVIVLREKTERPEGAATGALILAGTNEEKIFEVTHELLRDPEKYQKMTKNPNPYGDGEASKRILCVVREFLDI